MAAVQTADDLSTSQVRACISVSVCVLSAYLCFMHTLCTQKNACIQWRVVIDYIAIEVYIREINIALDALSECENEPVDGVTRTNGESILEAALQRVCRGENCISIFEDKRRAFIFCGCPALCLAPARITSHHRMDQRGSSFFCFFFYA